jgi:hypothetical protein
MYTPYNIFNIENNLPKYKPGGTTSSDYDVPQIGQTFFDDSSNTWKVVTEVNADGEVSKFTSLENYLDKNGLKGKFKDYTDDYALLESILTKDNVKNALWDRYQKNKSNVISGKGSRYKDIKSADELVGNYLNYEKKLMMVNANFSPDEIEELDLDATFEKGTKNRRTDRDLFLQQTGLYDRNNPDLSDLQVSAFQKMYDDIATIMNDPSVDKNVVKELDAISWAASGPVDTDSQTKKGKKGIGNISNIDAVVGNNTIKQTNEAKVKETPPPVITETPPPKQTSPPIIPGKLGKEGSMPPKEWFTQDVMNFMNTLAVPPKKYLPWAPTVDLQEPEYTLLDPTWQLQNNAALMNQQLQGLTGFGSGPSYVSNAAALAGKASEQSQNVLAEYDARNAMIQNQGEQAKTAIRNQENLANAERTKNLYDGTNIANQQYDNSRRQYLDRINKALVTGDYNATMAYNTNYLNPYEYYIDPSSGGIIRGNPNNYQELIASETDEAKIREANLDRILTDKKYINFDPEEKLRIYENLYPTQTYPSGTYPSQGRSRRRQSVDDNYMRMLQQMYGTPTYPMVG